jgi:hypothetical protein
MTTTLVPQFLSTSPRRRLAVFATAVGMVLLAALTTVLLVVTHHHGGAAGGRCSQPYDPACAVTGVVHFC